MTSNKFITCFAYFVSLKIHLKLKKNITIFERKILDVRGTSLQRKRSIYTYTYIYKMTFHIATLSKDGKEELEGITISREILLEIIEDGLK